MTGKILPRDFYSRNTLTLARELLGKVLVKGETAGVIVETEAYPGGEDLASHSAAGITSRTKVIFGPPGHAYVYLCYGMHVCMNIVVDQEGSPGCVLIRALEPVGGLEVMRGRRQRARTDRELTSGPAKLTQALGIVLDDYGADLTRGGLTVRSPRHHQNFAIEVTPRVGLRKCEDSPLRFIIAGNEFVSG